MGYYFDCRFPTAKTELIPGFHTNRMELKITERHLFYCKGYTAAIEMRRKCEVLSGLTGSRLKPPQKPVVRSGERDILFTLSLNARIWTLNRVDKHKNSPSVTSTMRITRRLTHKSRTISDQCDKHSDSSSTCIIPRQNDMPEL
jgi:hypothetical protein